MMLWVLVLQITCGALLVAPAFAACEIGGCAIPPSKPLTPHDAAIARCFQTAPWVDKDGKWIDKCLATVPN